METVTVHTYFHAGHRQLNYPGKCEWVHGHTWRARIVVSADEFPRDDLDMSLDFAELKAVARKLDHKMMVSEQDKHFLEKANFDPEGVVLIRGKGPSVENVARHIWEGVVEHIRGKFPGLDISYEIEVQLQETENNLFTIRNSVHI